MDFTVLTHVEVNVPYDTSLEPGTEVACRIPDGTGAVHYTVQESDRIVYITVPEHKGKVMRRVRILPMRHDQAWKGLDSNAS